MTGESEGFTLLEVMLVFVILGIVALVFAPAFLGQDLEKQLAAAGREVEGALRFARGEAMAGNKEITVSFDTAAESFQVSETATGAYLLHPGTKSSYRVVFPDSVYKGVDLISINGLSGVRPVVIRPSGAPAAAAAIVFTRGVYSRTVLVDENTGRIWTQSP